MKLIWLSVAPYAPTGYGLVTREVVSRMIKAGHEVTVATKHFHCGDVEWHGIHTIIGTDIGILNRMLEHGEADYIISLLDDHALEGIPQKWISYTPFDTHHIPQSIAKWLIYPEMIIALTRHGQKEIESLGYECFYAPHGVDTNVYYPDEKKRQEGRENLGWQDNFIIGSVGVNYEDDRKNFVNLVMAFKKFHDKYDEARLFLSTNPRDTAGNDYLPMVIQNLGLNQMVKWPLPDPYFLGRVTDQNMANRYRQLDLFCMPTRGEGFGIPLIEAEASGLPVVTTGASTGPELCPDQYLIPVQDHEWQWFNKQWRPNVNSQSIYEALERAYNDSNRKEVAKKGLEFAKTYDWDLVFETYWKPILKEIEGLKVKVKTIPDYRKLYETFDGRIMMSDCGQWCGHKCKDSSTIELLPGEKPTARPILARTFPVWPDRDGDLLVDTECPLYKWLSKKFIKEVKETWNYLWGFPVIRKSWRSFYMDEFTPLQFIKQDFNDEYKWAMQSQYYTNFPDISKYINGPVLEVGCGNGKRVRELVDKGINAVGIEINPAQVSEIVKLGNAEALGFDDNSFGTVYSVDLLEHLRNPLQGLSEMFRVSSDMVINSITPVDDPCFMQDPTHKVEWDRERWKREINEFGEIINILEPFTVIAKRREICQQ